MDQWKDLVRPLLNSSQDQDNDPLSSFVSLRNEEEDQFTHVKSQETKKSYDNQMKQTIFSFNTLILSNVVCMVVLLIDGTPKFQCNCVLFVIMGSTHLGYILGVLKDLFNPLQQPVITYYHQLNRLIVNLLMILLLAFSSTKVTEETLMVYWLVVIFLLIDMISIISGLFFDDNDNIFLSTLLIYLKVLTGVTLLYDILRFHTGLDFWIISVSIMFITSLIIPFLSNWSNLRNRIFFHSIFVISIIYLDLSLFNLTKLSV